MKENKKKILHFCSNPWFSAISDYALTAAAALARRGHDNTFVMLEQSAARPQAEKMSHEFGFKLHYVSAFSLRHVFKLRSFLMHRQPDALLLYGGRETALTRWLNTPRFTYRFLGQYQLSIRQQNPWLRYFSYGHCCGFLVPSESFKKMLIKDGLSADHLHLVELGRREDLFRLAKSSSEVSRFEILILARFDPIKGHQQAFKIFSRLMKIWPTQNPPLCLHIAGREENISLAQLRRWAQQFDLEEGKHIKFTAAKKLNVPQLIAQAQIGWIPSLGSEVICRVAEEFLLCGLPIIVSGVGSLEDSLFENAGISLKGLSEEQSAVIMKAFMEQILLESWDQKIQRAQTAHKRFSLTQMGVALEKLFD